VGQECCEIHWQNRFELKLHNKKKVLELRWTKQLEMKNLNNTNQEMIWHHLVWMQQWPSCMAMENTGDSEFELKTIPDIDDHKT
jgi:hypothetical protein